MELRLAPTSPKKSSERQAQLLQKNDSPQQKKERASTFGVFIFSAIIGIIAGAASALFIFTQSDWFGFITNIQPTAVISGDGSRTFAQHELMVQSVQAKIAPTTLMVYREPSETSSVGERAIFVGEAVFITSDGLAMTTTSVLATDAAYLAVSSTGKTQSITDVYRDSRSGLAFFKFSGNGFTAVQLKKQDVAFPQSPLYLSWHQNVFNALTTVTTQLNRSTASQAMLSEQFFSTVTLTQTQGDIPQGAFLFSDDGSLYGFFSGNKENPSVAYLPERKSVIDSFLSAKKVEYNYLGVRGIPLATTITKISSSSFGYTKGFRVLSSVSDPAIEKNSPASKANIKEGDILLKFGSQVIDADHPLQSLLLQSVSQAVDVTVLRNEKELVVQVQLEKRP